MFTAHASIRSIGALASLLLTCTVLLPVQPALAGPLRLIQDWERDDFATSGFTARTGATFDNSGITGIGAERAYVTALNFAISLFGVGQNFFDANIIDPLTFGQESDPYVDYQDGVLIGIRQLDLGGNSGLGLVPGGHGLIMSATTLRYFTSPGTQDYILVSSELVSLPEPGPLSLLATAWFLSFIALRRRARPTHDSG